MTADTQTRERLDRASGQGPGVHLVCCDEDLSLCRRDMSAEPYVDDEVDCVDCILLQGQPCGYPDCPDLPSIDTP